MIKNIPTTYNGVTYRSRLEARWAVFFDELGIKHIYEHEGFKLDDNEYYLPDFYLPFYNIYCEVKPTFDEVKANETTFKSFTKTSHWLLMLVSLPNVNTTLLYQKHETLNVIPFVNIIKNKYGNFWHSEHKPGCNKDGFIDYNLFNKAVKIAEKYKFY